MKQALALGTLLASLWLLLSAQAFAGGANPIDYDKTRGFALSLTRKQLDLPATAQSNDPFGIAMDENTDSHIATLVAWSNGATSLYLNSGESYIGIGVSDSNSPNALARKLVTDAGKYKIIFDKAENTDLPEPGYVRFYFLTDSGKYTATAKRDELLRHAHPLSMLYDEAEKTIAAIHGPAKK